MAPRVAPPIFFKWRFEMVVKSAILKDLEALYAKQGNQLCVVYGRADSEKERIIRSFLQNKKSFYYRARQVSPAEQLVLMGRELAEHYDASIARNTYEEFFNRVKSGDPTKLVVVVDEFQYIAKKDESFMAAVLKLKAKRLYPGPVMIVLCSSAVAWVEKELDGLLGETAARKIDEKVKIPNLNFLEVVRALPDYPVSECIKVYGIIGGVPGYINRWDEKRDIRDNICRLILSPSGYMFGAAEALISSSLRELSVYETILSHISLGHDKLNDLFQETGFSRAKISVYMKNLAAFDIIQKVVSFETGGWENAKKGVYRISDNYVNFWFHFIHPHLSDLYVLEPEEFYDRHIGPGMDSYISRYFTEVCMEYLELLDKVGKLPLKIHKIGTWVGKEGNIDIIAQNEIRQNMVGLCNWERDEVTMEMCDELFSNMKKARIGAEYYFLFSAKSFDGRVKAMAEEDKRFVLVDMNEL